MSNEYKDKVYRAVVCQFKEELKVTQKGVIKRLGGGSEQTIAKYIGIIKAEISEKEIALFSPSLPPELIPILEGIYNKSMEFAVLALDDERQGHNLKTQKAIDEKNAAKSSLEAEVEFSRSRDIELIESKNANETLKNDNLRIQKIYEEQAALLIVTTNKMDGLIEKGKLDKLTLANEYKEALFETKQDYREQVNTYILQVAKVENEKIEVAKQIDFERSRSTDETARLYREIDLIKTQWKEEKLALAAVSRRLESELDISHAREDRDQGIKSDLENRLNDSVNELIKLKNSDVKKQIEG
jgi:hypothetical protein